MTLLQECAWTAARSLAVAAAAVALARPVTALVAHRGRGSPRLAAALVALPFVTPAIVVGYAWTSLFPSRIHYPALNELFYSLLLLVRFTPVAALLLFVAPSLISRDAAYCRRLARGSKQIVPGTISFAASCGDWWRFTVRGPALKWIVALAMVWLLAFADFELAGRLEVHTWTVKLLDAHACRLPLGESMWLVSVPLALEAAALAVVLALVFSGRTRPQLLRDAPPAPGAAGRALAWTWIAAALALGTILPLGVVLRGTLSGFRVLAQSRTLMGDVVTSVVLCSVVAVAAFFLASGLVAMVRRSRIAGTAAALVCVPGLLGSLVLGVLVLDAFQQPGLRAVNDTFVPIFVALVLLTLPYAVLLMGLLRVERTGESLHAARLLSCSSDAGVRRNAAALRWELRGRARALVVAAIFVVAYFDVVASHLLSPAGRTPVFARLYNLIHYGQTPGLSAMVFVSMAVPAVFAVVLVLGGRAVILSPLSRPRGRGSG